jgi:tetratricopeptide (TPR) repeat protein
VELHKQEPLRTLHSEYESFSRYYNIGFLYYRAEQILNAVEAMKRCIQICEELWTSPPEEVLFSSYLSAWISLSSCYGRLGHLSKSSKTIRRALNLVEEFPENLEKVAYSMDEIMEMVEKADQHLKKTRQKRRKALRKCSILHRLRALQSYWSDSSKVAAHGSGSKTRVRAKTRSYSSRRNGGTRHGTRVEETLSITFENIP